MIYAWRISTKTGARLMLVEFKSAKQLNETNAANAAQGGAEPPHYYEKTTRQHAHKWVRDGRVHETGLWLDDLRRIRGS